MIPIEPARTYASENGKSSTLEGKKPVTLTGLLKGLARVDSIVKNGFFTAAAISVTSAKAAPKKS